MSKRTALSVTIGLASAGFVFLLAALIASPHPDMNSGNSQDAWNCFWAAGACFVLAGVGCALSGLPE